MLSAITRSCHPLRAASSGVISVGAAIIAATISSDVSSRAEAEEPALSPKEWRSFTVEHVRELTHNTKLIRFSLPSKTQEMGITVASCLTVRADINGKKEVRPYTPVSSNSEKGILELVVKGYEKGKVSKHICNMKVGDSLEFKGPWVKFTYKPNSRKKIGMIAGGSGITPMLQVIREIVRNPEDHTEIHLLFANVTEDDIMLREEIDALCHLYPNLTVTYCLDKPPENWDGESGYITKEMIVKYMPEPSEDNLVLVCGPPPMMYHISGDKAKDKTQGAVEGLLKDLKYTSAMVFKF